MRRQKSEFNEINFKLLKASQYKPTESTVSGKKLWFHHLLAKSLPQKLQLCPTEANPWITKIKTWRDKRKVIADGHCDSCPHLEKQSTAAIMQWQFQLRRVVLLQHRWECTFPDCVCWLVLSQYVLIATLAGEAHVRLWQAGKQHNKQKPQKENSAGALVFSSAFLIPHVVCP